MILNVWPKFYTTEESQDHVLRYEGPGQRQKQALRWFYKISCTQCVFICVYLVVYVQCYEPCHSQQHSQTLGCVSLWEILHLFNLNTRREAAERENRGVGRKLERMLTRERENTLKQRRWAELLRSPLITDHTLLSLSPSPSLSVFSLTGNPVMRPWWIINMLPVQKTPALGKA